MTVHGVWFWMPFHMLQAYAMTRVLPIPDFIIPFAHLVWLPVYIAEHWAGLCDPVFTAFQFDRAFGDLFVALTALAFWYFCHKKSENKTLVKIMCFLFFAFMAMSMGGWFGFIGSPKKTYEGRILANADPLFNKHHTILHVWYLSCQWIATLTVPFEKLTTGGTAMYRQIPDNTNSV